MSTDDRLRLRATFDRIADVYDRVRPTYPAEVFDHVPLAGARVLEIGCGTGQASVALAERADRLLAVELGPRLATLATRRLASHRSAEVVTADFDRWTGEPGGFDVVFSATAFHWLDPATRFGRIAELLVPGGVLATVFTQHVAGGTPGFFEEAAACYRRFYPEADPPPVPAAEFPHDTGVDPTFGPTEFHRYEWTIEYGTADYLDLLRTYSTTLAMSGPTAAGLLRCVGALIDGRYGGRVAKRYLAELRVTHSPA